jgi:hypothetical protein
MDSHSRNTLLHFSLVRIHHIHQYKPLVPRAQQSHDSVCYLTIRLTLPPANTSTVRHLTWTPHRRREPVSAYSSRSARQASIHVLDFSMDNLPATMTDRARTGREPLPNLRGEDETEIQVLTNLIESTYLADHCSASRLADYRQAKLGFCSR